MSKIVLKALAGETNASDIDTLNGVECPDDFVEYMDEEDYPFVSNLESGYMSFKVIDGILYTITEYFLREGASLTDDEIAKLIDYTQGQWSDGIGEGFEQSPVAEEDGEDIYISPWSRGQKVTYTIE